MVLLSFKLLIFNRLIAASRPVLLALDPEEC